MLRKLFQMQNLLDALFDEVWFNFGIPEATHHVEMSAD